MPIARSPADISAVSRARSGRRIELDAVARAERTNARADIDLDPGSRTVVTTGREAVGAVHAVGPGCSVMLGTYPFCRSGRSADMSGTVALMCGRYASTRSAADLATLFEATDETDGDLVPDFNIAPTDPAPIVRQSSRGETPVLTVARWGLVPAWSRDASGGARMINARAETVVTSKAFARSFAERRCLVPADGWYEWRRLAKAVRQPYFMTHPDSLAFGGIWTSWSAGNAGAGAVGSAEVLGGAVGSAEVLGGAVGSAEVLGGAVGSAEVLGGAVGSAEVIACLHSAFSLFRRTVISRSSMTGCRWY